MHAQVLMYAFAYWTRRVNARMLMFRLFGSVHGKQSCLMPVCSSSVLMRASLTHYSMCSCAFVQRFQTDNQGSGCRCIHTIREMIRSHAYHATISSLACIIKMWAHWKFKSKLSASLSLGHSLIMPNFSQALCETCDSFFPFSFWLHNSKRSSRLRRSTSLLWASQPCLLVPSIKC